MQPTIEILEKVSQSSMANKDEVFTRLFRYLLRPDIYYVAYRNLYANNGAATKGVDEDTADGFSESKIQAITAKLADGSYSPKPSRRTYIEKANGKLRPLGIPTFTDKLVQEVLRMILEAVYEPVFLDYSHGFRPKRSCHTALKDVKHQFHGTRWFVEGDIKGCFDNINHNTLIGFINTKIKDARFIQLIYKFLKAGYLEDWKYNKTHSGTPQGGIVSPILANIYLHELDKFVDKLKAKFNEPSEKRLTSEYKAQHDKVALLKLRINNKCNESIRPELLRQWKEARAILMTIPSKAQTDKCIKYIRYADDFIIGVNGSKADCEWIKSELKTFIAETLKMELSDEKTLITHSSDKARFLGYDIAVRRNGIIKQGGRGVTKRTLNNMTGLSIPLKDKIEKFLFEIEAVEVKDGKLFPVKRTKLFNLTELEIVTTYNAELRGICNYYSMASNFFKLQFFSYLMEYSCLKTIAAKHKCSIGQVIAKFSDGNGSWAIPYKTKKGECKIRFAKYQDCKNAKNADDKISVVHNMFQSSRNSFEVRLMAKTCELCGSSENEHYEIHHINKVKNLSGKEPWERIMIAKRRKTMVLCRECHKRIHGKTVEN